LGGLHTCRGNSSMVRWRPLGRYELERRKEGERPTGDTIYKEKRGTEGKDTRVVIEKIPSMSQTKGIEILPPGKTAAHPVLKRRKGETQLNELPNVGWVGEEEKIDCKTTGIEKSPSHTVGADRPVKQS